MELRGNRVLARCDDSGELRVAGGRVEIRYRPGDGRAYQAAARNLLPVAGAPLLPDEHCAPAEPVAPTSTRKGKAAKAGSPGSYPTKPVEGEALAYADGACSGNPGPAGLGVVLLWGDRRSELSEYLGEATNNIAELTAILRVADQVRELGCPLRLYTDSGYAIGVLSRGWKAKANKDLVARVRAALSRLPEVSLMHVRGHAGVPLNERADELARQAIEQRAGGRWVDVAARRA